MYTIVVIVYEFFLSMLQTCLQVSYVLVILSFRGNNRTETELQHKLMRTITVRLNL